MLLLFISPFIFCLLPLYKRKANLSFFKSYDGTFLWDIKITGVLNKGDSFQMPFPRGSVPWEQSKKNWMEQFFILSIWQMLGKTALSFLQLKFKVEWWSSRQVLTCILFELKKKEDLNTGSKYNLTHWFNNNDCLYYLGYRIDIIHRLNEIKSHLAF